MKMESVDNPVSNGQMLELCCCCFFFQIDSNYKEAVEVWKIQQCSGKDSWPSNTL